MDGRLENAISVQNRVRYKLTNAPVFLKEYGDMLLFSKQPKTCDDFINKILHYFHFINEDISQVTVQDLCSNVTQYLNSKKMKVVTNRETGQLEQKPTTIAYQHGIYAALNSFFEYLVFKNYITKNPLIIVDKPKGEDKVKRLVLTPVDLQEILVSVDYGVGSNRAIAKQQTWKERDKLILYLLMITGMRIGALTQIDITDINFTTEILTVIDKGHKVMEYDISCIFSELEAWLVKRKQLLEQVNKDTNALFISSLRSRMTEKTISNLIAKYAEDALGYTISPHKLRAAFCTNLYEETHDIELVRRVVGHANVKTTQRYIVGDVGALRSKSSNIIAKQIGIN